MTRQQRAEAKRGAASRAQAGSDASRTGRRSAGQSASNTRQRPVREGDGGRSASRVRPKRASGAAAVREGGRGNDGKRDTRASDKVQASTGKRRSDHAPQKRKGGPGGKARIVLAVVVVLVLCCVIVYPMGKGYYQTMREGQRLQAQIDAVNERNATLQDEADALQTDEGIEAQARDDYNYVKEGEHAASVTNAQGSSGSTDLPAQVDEDSIKAPQTWYYAILDVIFFYSD